MCTAESSFTHPSINFGLDLVSPLFRIIEHAKKSVSHFSILGHSGIWEVIQLDTFPSIIGERVAGAAGVDGAARGVDVGAESFSGLGGAG